MHSTPPESRRRLMPAAPIWVIFLAITCVIGACTSQAAAGDPASQLQSPGSGAGASDPGDVQPSAAPISPAPQPTLPHVPPLQPPAYASRIVLEDLGIDLPVVSGDLVPPPSYPLCDVAAYVTLFGQPYEQGITYISAHAQRRMFAPILAASERNDGQEMIGMTVQVYVSDGRRFDYRIDRVVRHATDYAVVDEIPLDEQTLIMQTSEGVYGTLPKVQVIATFESETAVDLAVANPEPHPRDCDPSHSPAPTP